MSSSIEALGDPEEIGALKVPRFVGRRLLSRVQSELNDSHAVAWRDNHKTYVNKRGITIVQNHDVYALKLSAGDQTPLERIPALVTAMMGVSLFVESIADQYPNLSSWKPDEMSLHRYDDPEVGLSYHKDNLRFTGVIAILSVSGNCDLMARFNERETTMTTEPGDLFLLRATGLTDSDEDLRPEHAIVNLRTPERASMMLRDNNRPSEVIEGFVFDNWPESST